MRGQDLPALVARNDVIFTAPAHRHAMAVAREVLEAGKALVDLGADFTSPRPCSLSRNGIRWSTAAELLPQAVYGLPEITGTSRALG
ncbi:MAG: hypothetical protein IMW93_00660 [Thermoanaerobacteraceae bacterium]|nr:hypothetical protein [Thermoanaerobacteraceae bacterium]